MKGLENAIRNLNSLDIRSNRNDVMLKMLH